MPQVVVPVPDRAAQPDAARAKKCVAVLRTSAPDSLEMYEAFRELDALPVDVVRAEFAAWMGPLPDLDQLDDATRRAFRLPLRPLRLQVLSTDRDADIFDLGPIAEEQVRLAGRSWDGVDLPAEERLDGELEGSFAGTLQRLVLADAGTALFDVVLFADDAGIVFSTGTTKQLALIAYGKVEMRDPRTRVAIEEAIAGRATSDVPHEVKVIDQAPAPVKVPTKTATKTKSPTRKTTPAAKKSATRPAARKPAPATKSAKTKTATTAKKKTAKKTATRR